MTDEHDAIATPGALRPAVDLLNDAHHHLHDAEEAYHEPEDFRRHIESMIQALRNITWRVQSAKADLPADFDRWYSEWQELMKNDAMLAWLNEARVDVVHRSGLNPNSRAIVRVIDSYRSPTTVLLALPARTSTDRVVSVARQRVPQEIQQHVAIEVLRHWSVAELDDAELIEVLTHCWHVLDALLVYIAELAVGGDPEAPAEFVASVQLPPCMYVNPSCVPIVAKADTGEIYGIDFVPEHRDDVGVEEAVRRYRAKSLPVLEQSTTIRELARSFHEYARRIFKTDGYHIPILRLFGPDGGDLFVMMAEDKRDKFMQWQRVGRYVAMHDIDSFIFTTEIWHLVSNVELEPYQDIETMPGRREALVTHYEDADGNRGSYMSEIVRVLGKAFLKKTTEHEYGEEAAMYAMPVRKAWVERARTESRTGRRPSASASEHSSTTRHDS